MRKTQRNILVACAAVLLFSQSARADHAIAMHGAPLYPESYKSFDYVNREAPKGGALNVCKTGSFDSLNKHVILGNVPDEGLDLVDSPLMQRAWNEPFTLYGLAAESVDVAPDRSSITFHLNKNARFHDGVPMTAEDVKFSFDAYRKNGHPVRRRVYGLVSDVKILSKRDIKFTFGKGYDRESVMILAMMPVLPKHYWEKHDLAKTTLEPPLGSGPYKIKSVVPGRSLVLERVRDYWGKDLPVNKGLYNFDTVTYTYFRDDDIALQSFAAGTCNFRRENNVHKWMAAYDFKALRDGRMLKEEIAHQRPEWLRAMIYNTRRPLFADRRVREALGLMFNFEWVNKNLYFGAQKRIASSFPNAALAASGKPEGEELAQLEKHKADLPPEVFGDAWQPPSGDARANQRKAIALLKEAGWIYKDEKLVNATTGAPFAFEILLNEAAGEKIALEFARSLKKIGIEARVRTVDSAQFVGRLDGFDYDMVVYRWINSLSPGNEQLNYWGTNAAAKNGTRNYAGIQNPAIDDLADSIAKAETRSALVARAHALDRALMWGYYMIPLNYLGRDLIAHAATLHRPEKPPIYGTVPESWWHSPAK